MGTWRFLTVALAVAVILANCQVQCANANILFYHGVGTYSHRITVWRYIQGLLDSGHNVTIFQPTQHPPTHRLQDPRVHDFFPDELHKVIFGPSVTANEVGHSFLQARLADGHFRNAWYATATRMPEKNIFICSALLNSTVGQAWIQSAHFDLVIMDGAYNECTLGLAYRWQAKVILFGTSALFSWYQEPFALATFDASWIPDTHLSFLTPMTLTQRAMTALLPLAYYWNKLWWYYPQLEAVLRTGLALPDMPPLHELEQRVSLMFINSHWSEEYARPLPPFVVPVGGIHLDSVKNRSQNTTLPKVLTRFIDECAADGRGFILISFGSAVRIVDAPEQLRTVFYNALAASVNEACFVWKWEGKRPAEMPENVFTAEWLPQEEILGDPRCQAFVTHAGLMSIQEAIAAAVPLLALPVFADQDYNAFRIQQRQIGIHIDIGTLTTVRLTKAIRDIVRNSKYKSNMVRMRKLFQDRPQSPLETALWWTEYVLRHNDTEHLKSGALCGQAWYERRLLDVWAFVLAIVTVLGVVIYRIIRLGCSCLWFVLKRGVLVGKKLKFE